MSWTRLLHIVTGVTQKFELHDLPPFIAISHTWAEALFPATLSFPTQPGSQAVRQVQAKCYPQLTFCWIDTICIDQDDEEDKRRQVPQMGVIYGKAEAVVIVFSTPIGLTQTSIDDATQNIEGALEMFRNDTWKEEGLKWEKEPRRQALKNAMDMLNCFTKSPWATRVWTLQEYILSKTIVWIGQDLEPLKVEDEPFIALPDICETLSINELILGPYTILYQYYRGMAGASAKTIDQTRVMELLGNRNASLAVDEVFGVMAASGVIVTDMEVEDKEEAWRLWWMQAITEAHVRWALLPPVPTDSTDSSICRNCVMPSFAMRHLASANSGLDKVGPIRSARVEDNSVILTGRWAGFCRIICRLGHIPHDDEGRVHRDITLILFASDNWTRSLRIARAFGGGRYSHRQILIIAQVLKHNYYHARMAVQLQKEEEFRPLFRNHLYQFVWSDFMLLQSIQMMIINDCAAYLAEMSNGSSTTDIAIAVAPDERPEGSLMALDFEAKTASNKTVLTVVKIPSEATILGEPSELATISLHKVGVTVANEMADIVTAHRYSRLTLPGSSLYEFRLGGDQCIQCNQNRQSDAQTTDNKELKHDRGIKRLKARDFLRMRVQKRIMTGAGGLRGLSQHNRRRLVRLRQGSAVKIERG